MLLENEVVYFLIVFISFLGHIENCFSIVNRKTKKPMLPYDSVRQSKMDVEVLQDDSRTSRNETTSKTVVTDSENRITSPNILEDKMKTNGILSETLPHHQFFERKHINLESHQLILLEKNLNDLGQGEAIFTLEELRKIVDYTKFINNIEDTIQFIEQTKETTTFLICSCDLDQIIVPKIHLLKNIRSIYIYCHDEHDHKQWSDDYTKVCMMYKISIYFVLKPSNSSHIII